MWKEACPFRTRDTTSQYCAQRARATSKGTKSSRAFTFTAIRLPKEGNTPLGYIWEYGCALFWEFFIRGGSISRRGFHVIQGCNPPDDIFLVALPFKLFGVKYIFDHHDANPELYLSKYEQRRTSCTRPRCGWRRLTYRFSDVVMATNDSYRDLAVSRGGLDPEDVFVVRNGPDLKTFKAVPPNPALKYGKPYLVGYVGTMSIQEGLDILLDVALHIKNLGRRDVHFTCVGGGPGLAGLRKMVEDKNLERHGQFHGQDSRRAVAGDPLNRGCLRQSGQAVRNE